MNNELKSQKKPRFKSSTYQAASVIAPVIYAHFRKFIEATYSSENSTLHPDQQVIEAIIDTAFWASLRREEGISPRISLALLPPEQAVNPIVFEHKLALSADMLTKIAPGVERPGIHVGVWFENEEIYVWGTTHNIPDNCLVVDVSEPGLLVIKHRRKAGFGKFLNIAVLKGDQIKIIDETSAHLPDCPNLLTSLLGFRSEGQGSVNVLIQLAVSMRAHNQGGLLLVVPSGSNGWRESIFQPMKYSVSPVFTTLGDLIIQGESEKNKSPWQNALAIEISSIAGLTAIDGATVITDTHELLAFGTKIIRSPANQIVGQIITTEPIVGSEALVVNPSTNGGTRHMSAAQFVNDQRDSLALVASQDGHFTVFTWSPCENMVHAHRIDALLL
ncbi:MAG: hypothetical protein H7096_12295 [Flavobacterium sp.]|nr:hypothetical protein [Pedobacter sp.]